MFNGATIFLYPRGIYEMDFVRFKNRHIEQVERRYTNRYSVRERYNRESRGLGHFSVPLGTFPIKDNSVSRGRCPNFT